jgi:hypothetical protein
MIGTPRGNPAGNDGGNSGGNAGGNVGGLAELLATLERRAAEAERIQVRSAWAQSLSRGLLCSFKGGL